MKRNPPIGTSWRILAGGVGNEPALDIRSKDYPRNSILAAEKPGAEVVIGRQYRKGKHRQTFDELVISGVLHVEAMDARTWCVILGDEIRMVTVKRDGRVVVGEMYK